MRKQCRSLRTSRESSFRPGVRRQTRVGPPLVGTGEPPLDEKGIDGGAVLEVEMREQEATVVSCPPRLEPEGDAASLDQPGEMCPRLLLSGFENGHPPEPNARNASLRNLVRSIDDDGSTIENVEHFEGSTLIVGKIAVRSHQQTAAVIEHRKCNEGKERGDSRPSSGSDGWWDAHWFMGSTDAGAVRCMKCAAAFVIGECANALVTAVELRGERRRWPFGGALSAASCGAGLGDSWSLSAPGVVGAMTPRPAARPVWFWRSS